MEQSGAKTGLLARFRLGRAAAAVRGMAGTPAGLVRSRRGTVLVLVLGALALISVITLVYATIGKADRRGSQVVAQKSSVHTTVSTIAEYIAGVIADGAMAVHVDGEDGAGNPSLVRTAADYPSTDPVRVSIGSGALLARAFDPTGSYDTLWTSSPLDPRVPSTPFLASSAPTALVYNAAVTPLYSQFRDWRHITNVSPNGRFVNLHNLRNNFDASSTMTVGGGGAGTTQFGDLSHNLVLMDASGNPTTTLPNGNAADPNRPSDWDSNQVGAFRPLTGPSFYPGAAAANSPGHEWYAPYQWADTDGDGIADARWFELVNSRDVNNPVSLLPRDDRFRWFIATRIMDLSGSLNVNTATDFRSAPYATAALPGQTLPPGTQITKAGLYPSDLDLRRALTNNDFHWRFTDGYNMIPQPAAAPPENYSGYDMIAASGVGGRAYDALRIALRKESPAVLHWSTALDPFMQSMTPQLQTFYSDDRARYYTEFGGQPTAGLISTPSGAAFGQSSRFGMADLLELLAFHGINNAGVTSRLEQATEGRFGQQNGGSNATQSYGPLRGNRSTAVEKGMLDVNPQNGVLDSEAVLLALSDIRRRVTTDSGARPLRSTPVPGSLVGMLDSSLDLRIDLIEALEAATVTTANARNPSLLLDGIAQGMLPHLSRTGAWNPTSTPRYRTMHYGNSPELGVRLAAHLAANHIDSFDTDNTPSAFSVLLDVDRRNSFHPDDFPWWREPGATNPGRLDLGDSRLASRNRGDTLFAASGGFNAYGVEAQPFVTQAFSMVFYTDSPDLPPEPPGTEITIRGGVSPDPAGNDNPDYLGAVLAFQITNPFDHPVNLSRVQNSSTSSRQPIAPDNWTEFYIEYGGYLIMLAEWSIDETTGEQTLREIVLDPGETRVVYCTSYPLDSRFDTNRTGSMEERFRDASASLPPAPGHFMQSMLENQLSIRTGTGLRRPALVPIMQAGAGAGQFIPRPRTDAIDLFSSVNLTAKSNVYLWRNLHGQSEPLTNGTSTTNFRSNDMLADRLRDPQSVTGGRFTPTLERLLTAGDKEVQNTIVEDDDTGYSIVLWGSIRRRDDPNATTIPLGAIPAYCVEAKWGAGTGTGTLQNFRDVEPSSLSRLDKGQFVATAENGHDTLAGLANKLTRGSGIITRADITKPPENRSGTSIGSNLTGASFQSLYPQIPLNNRRYIAGTGPAAISTMRIADILLPLAIGPSYDPPDRASRVPTHQAPDPDRCLTLSEALGLALNYSAPNATDPVFGLYAGIGAPITGALDRGNLVLDRFVPFEDVNGNLLYDPPPAGQEPTRFPGIPVALNLLNAFRTIDPQFGSLTKATPGVLNINTAPTGNIRSVPLLSPTTEVDTVTGQNIWPNWLAQAGVVAGTTMPMPPSSVGAADGTDIPAAFEAYRDKTIIYDRSNRPNDFTDGAQPGRFLTTRIDGLREAPGFGSIAEIMAVTRRRLAAADPLNPPEPRLDVLNRIDFLRGDNQPSGAAGVNSTLYQPRPYVTTTNPPRNPDTINDDYSEKLTIAAAAMNSISVRSDIFAVWFVVHGYQRSDTEGLKPEDPLVPSVAKRFVMVVDRSNVTRKGQQPKILLFTEVPL